MSDCHIELDLKRFAGEACVIIKKKGTCASVLSLESSDGLEWSGEVGSVDTPALNAALVKLRGWIRNAQMGVHGERLPLKLEVGVTNYGKVKRYAGDPTIFGTPYSDQTSVTVSVMTDNDANALIKCFTELRERLLGIL